MRGCQVGVITLNPIDMNEHLTALGRGLPYGQKNSKWEEEVIRRNRTNSTNDTHNVDNLNNHSNTQLLSVFDTILAEDGSAPLGTKSNPWNHWDLSSPADMARVQLATTNLPNDTVRHTITIGCIQKV